jgi:amino acid transporter
MERINPAFGPVIAVFVTTTAISSLNAIILAQSRMVSAAARRHHLPAVLGTLNEKYNMPWAAILFLVSVLPIYT